jgi:hypothetical protein
MPSGNNWLPNAFKIILAYWRGNMKTNVLLLGFLLGLP